ncbi:MAG: hypothetical protein RR348_01500 [Clostridia bacterium]
MKFRDLKESEIEVRIGNVGKNYLTLLLYKNARVDMQILDESGCKWQRKHYELKGNMYCSVGIYDNELNQWIWRDDCGVESYAEKEKGESSDSFKRACVNFGIGRELYTAPKIFINGYVKQNDKGKDEATINNFNVEKVKIENGEIVGLSITAYDKTDKKTKRIFVWTKAELMENK